MDSLNVELDNVSLSSQIYKALKNQIIEGDFKPNERLVIDKIADEIGVSSTPVRDALQKLISSGFAEKKNNGGIYVISLTRKDIEELFDIREVLEGLAARLVSEEIKNNPDYADKFESLHEMFKQKEEALVDKEDYISHSLDVKLHDLILEITPNKRLKKQIKLIMNQTYCIRSNQHQSKIRDFQQKKNPTRLLEETREHKNIIDLILREKTLEVEKKMRKHIQASKKDILEHYESMPN